MGLDALDQTPVGVGGVHAGLHVDAAGGVEIGVVMTLQPAHRVDGNEGHHVALGRLDDEIAKAGEGHATRPAVIHQGGDAGAHADQVRVEAEAAADMLIDMGVGVDHAGQHQQTRRVHGLGAIGREAFADRFDAPVADGHVADAVNSGGRIDDGAPLEDEVSISSHETFLAGGVRGEDRNWRRSHCVRMIQ